MLRQIRAAAGILALLTIITGIVYPLAMTGLAQILFPAQANGSLIVRDGIVIGSKLIGQKFAGSGYFHGRPSAAGKDGYDASSSSGSNLGPTNQNLIDAVKNNVAKVRENNALAENASVPSDLVTTSGSGLDPHISPAAAYLQIERVARERGLPNDTVRQLVERQVEGRQWDFLGEPRINVLELNLELDALQ